MFGLEGALRLPPWSRCDRAGSGRLLNVGCLRHVVFLHEPGAGAA